MSIDPNNEVVQLCAQGMQSEGKGKFQEAARLFMEAWERSTNDYESCVAAHYVARHQKTPADTLYWNQLSLERAEAVGDNSVEGFYPSLYLNIGKAHEDLGNAVEAKRFYGLAAEKVGGLPEGSYGDVVRGAIERALKRMDVETFL